MEDIKKTNQELLLQQKLVEDVNPTAMNFQILGKERKEICELLLFNGIDFVFDKFPELEGMGTKEQYKEYLKTIFPESVYQSIVYHGGNQFEGRLKTEQGMYFSTSIKYAEEYLKINPQAIKLYAAILNIQQPTEISYINRAIIETLNNIKNNKNIDLNRYTGDELIFAKSVQEDEQLVKQIKESDSFIGTDFFYENNSSGYPVNIYSYGTPEDFYRLKDLAEESQTLVVFKPTQIHVLGSQKDLNGFKKFIHKTENFSPKKKKETKVFGNRKPQNIT